MYSSYKIYKSASGNRVYQLEEMVPEHSQVRQSLDEISEDCSLLNLNDLEACEKVYAAIQW